MYDHIERGWLAISFTALGLMSVLFILLLFMLGESPLGFRLFRIEKGNATSEQQTP